MVSSLLQKIGIGKKQKLTPEETEALASALSDQTYLGAVPFVDKAYRADPRTTTAAQLRQTGSDTSALSGGMTEGIARVLSGGLGGIVGDKQRDKYRLIDAHNANKYNTAAAPFIKGQAGLDQAVAAGSGAPPGVAAGGPPPPGAQQQQNVADVAGSLMQGAPGPASAMPQNFPQPGAPPVSTPPLTDSPLIPSQASPRVLTPGEPAGVGRRQAAAAAAAAGQGQDFSNYQSTAYDPIEAAMEKKYSLPPGTLKGLRFAEHSNINQESETGAKSVYQFVPGTRRAFKRKYGVDAWNSPQESVEAAALHIKESLDKGKDMNGALRDYRGVNEAQDPTWYQRARGDLMVGIKGGGGAGAAGAGEAGAAARGPVTPVDPMAKYDVPELEAPPERPTAPTLGDRVRSTRLKIASSLLGDNNFGNAAATYAMTQPLIEQGLTDDQAAMMQRDENLSQQANIGYQSDLTGYNQANDDIRGAKISERQAAVNANRAADTAQKAHEYKLNEQERAAQDDINLEIQKGKNRGGPKVSATMTNNYLAYKGITDRVARITALIKAHPEFSDILYGKLPEFLKSRTDADGVSTRAALSELTSYLLQKRSGASVTEGEYARQRGWLPTDGDTMGAAIDKLQQMQVGYAGDMENIRRFATDPNTGRSVFDSLDTPTAASAPALPKGVTVEQVK